MKALHSLAVLPAAILAGFLAAPVQGAETGTTAGKAGAAGNVLAPSARKTPSVRTEGVTAGISNSALTKEECEGIGGTVTWNSFCSRKNQQVCVTVDPHGRIAAYCINEPGQ